MALKNVQFRDYSSLPDDSLVDSKGVCTLTGKSRSTVYRWVAEGILTTPIRFNKSQNLWRLGDIRAVLRQASRLD